MFVLKVLQVFIELFNFSFFSITDWGRDLDYCDIEWFALEANRDHSVIFEIAGSRSLFSLYVFFQEFSGFRFYIQIFNPFWFDFCVVSPSFLTDVLVIISSIEHLNPRHFIFLCSSFMIMIFFSFPLYYSYNPQKESMKK